MTTAFSSLGAIEVWRDPKLLGPGVEWSFSARMTDIDSQKIEKLTYHIKDGETEFTSGSDAKTKAKVEFGISQARAMVRIRSRGWTGFVFEHDFTTEDGTVCTKGAPIPCTEEFIGLLPPAVIEGAVAFLDTLEPKRSPEEQKRFRAGSGSASPSEVGGATDANAARGAASG